MSRANAFDPRSLVELRERHAYEEAERLGAELWQRSDVPDADRADLAIQLALVYSEHAFASPPDGRDALWATAEQICAEFAARWPDHPRRPLVDVQAALVSLSHGEQLRDEALRRRTAAADLVPALEQFRTAAGRLLEIKSVVDEELVALRMRPNAIRPAGALSADELTSLSRNLAFESARALRSQALCFGPRTADRDDALLRAVDQLEPLAQQAPADALAWTARLELVAGLRELGRLQAAADRIASWSRDNPPPDVAARLVAEQVRVLLAAGQIDDARQLAEQAFAAAPAGNSAAAATLALSRLEASVAAWRAARQAGRERETRDLETQVDAIRDRFGPTWTRRAELLTSDIVASAPSGDAAASSRAAADSHRLAMLRMADDIRGAAPEDVATHAAAYEQQLREHLARWPTGPTAGDARWWLGKLLAARRDRPGATRALQPLITGAENRWPREWSLLQLRSALELGRLHLQDNTGDADYADRLLTAALAGRPADPADEEVTELRSEIRLLLAVARLRSGRPIDAADYGATIAAYAELADEHPDDGGIQENYAALLAQSDSVDALRAALAQWQRVEERSRRGEARWRRARAARIELLVRLGDREEAEKLQRLTRLLYPDWDADRRP